MRRGGKADVWDSEQVVRRAMGVTLTFQDGELGAGVDLPTSVGGRALVDGFVPVGAQRLDAQHGARAVIKLDHLSQDQSRTSGHAPRPSLAD